MRIILISAFALSASSRSSEQKSSEGTILDDEMHPNTV